MPKILVVDDEQRSREIIKEYAEFKTKGYREIEELSKLKSGNMELNVTEFSISIHNAQLRANRMARPYSCVLFLAFSGSSL